MKEQKLKCDNCGEEITTNGIIDAKGRVRVPDSVVPAGVLPFKEVHLRAQDFCNGDCLDEWVDKQAAKIAVRPIPTGGAE